MTGHNPEPLVIWRISDGRAGHDSQSHGLVRALEQLTPCEYYSVEAKKFKNRIFNFFSGKFPPGKNLPGPDLIIGAGHKTHLPVLCAQRARGGKTIVIMKPSLPYAMFDYCIVPEHDNPPDRENIITSRGALTMITPCNDQDELNGLVLIGGPSRHYSWDTDNIFNQLVEIIKQDTSMHWTITDSPRTPPETMEKLKSTQWQNVKLLPYSECDKNDLINLYRISGTIWVSEDSVTMVFEALSSGANVGILHVPRAGPSRVGNIIDDLSMKNNVTLFNSWRNTKQLAGPTTLFNESERCAKLLYQQAVCN